MRKVGLQGLLRCRQWNWAREHFLPQKRNTTQSEFRSAPATGDAKVARRSANDVIRRCRRPGLRAGLTQQEVSLAHQRHVECGRIPEDRASPAAVLGVGAPGGGCSPAAMLSLRGAQRTARLPRLHWMWWARDGSAVLSPPCWAGATLKWGLGLLAARRARPAYSTLLFAARSCQGQNGSSFFEITTPQLSLEAHRDVQERTEPGVPVTRLSPR